MSEANEVERRVSLAERNEVEKRKYTTEMQRIWGGEIAKAEQLVADVMENPMSHAHGDYVIELDPEDFLDLCAGKWHAG